MQVFISLFAAGVIFFPIYLISTAISESDRKQEKVKQDAIKKGNVVEACLKKGYAASLENPSHSMDRKRLGIYTYEYRGKRYTYRHSSEDLPYKLTLYFLYNPQKARPDGCIVTSRVSWPLLYTVIAFLIYYLFT